MERSLLQRQVISERKRKRLIFYTVFVVALLYIIMNLIGENGILRYVELKKRRDTLQEEILDLSVQNKALKTQIELLKNDPFYIEKYAREDFGLAAPGEHIFEYEK